MEFLEGNLLGARYVLHTESSRYDPLLCFAHRSDRTFGLDTSGYSFPYVATWAKDRQVLKRNLGEIQGVSRTLIEAIAAERSDPDDLAESHQSEEHLIARSLSPND